MVKLPLFYKILTMMSCLNEVTFVLCYASLLYMMSNGVPYLNHPKYRVNEILPRATFGKIMQNMFGILGGPLFKDICSFVLIGRHLFKVIYFTVHF